MGASAPKPARRRALAFVRIRTSRGRGADALDEPRRSPPPSASGLDDLADEVHRERLVRVELAPADRQLARDRAADEIVQRAVDDVAERALGMREPGRRRRDAQVAQDREVEPARERGAVDRGDRRQREAQHGVVVAVARRPELAAERVVVGGAR